MTNRIRGTLLIALAIAGVSATTADAAPVSVKLRVEGASRTIFDGSVTTDGHDITTPSSMGVAHPCDGTNMATFPSPVPTATAALDDAARLNGFAWDGTWFSFEDFQIDQIAGEASNSTQFWGLALNFKSTPSGGCTTKVSTGDEVLWIFDAFNKLHILKLAGPAAATTGTPVSVRVVDGTDGSGIPGASVGGKTTGADGRAALTFANAGIYRIKADRADSVRSNALTLCVDPPGADPCTSTDKTAPTVAASLPGRKLASERGHSRTMLISWQASDPAGAGVAYYSVDVRELSDGVGTAQASDWKPLVEHTVLTGVHFRGDSGSAYEFRITAVDRAANRTSVVTDPVVLPVDDRDGGLWKLSGWKRRHSASAWGSTVVRAKKAGATGALRFRGRSVSLIGRRLPNGGRLRVTLDGKSRTLRLRGHSRPRALLWTSPRLKAGSHLLRLRTLGGGAVELDAVAPRP
jgi:hypothetical protein